MKIAIISDIHDNLANLRKCLDWCAASGIEAVICCGDVANSETLAFLHDNFSGPIYLVRGNMEIYGEEMVARYERFIYGGRMSREKIGGKTIGICHEPDFVGKILDQGPADIVFYGHTHKPWISVSGRTTLVNPGTLGGVFQKATFAVWGTGDNKLELKLLEDL